MSRWPFKPPLVVALGRRQVAFALQRGPALGPPVDLPAEVGELIMELAPQRVAALREWLALRIAAFGETASPWQVMCTGELSRVWTLALPSGLKSLRELQEFARVRCMQMFGPSARAWQLGADWRVTDSLPCWALPAWIESLSGKAGTGAPRVLLAEVLGAVQRELPRNGWAVVVLPESAVILRLERGVARFVRALVLGGTEADALARIDAELRREALRLGESPLLDVPRVDARRLDTSARTDVALAAVLMRRTRDTAR